MPISNLFIHWKKFPRTYATHREHLSRNPVRVPPKDLPAARGGCVLAGIPRGSLLYSLGCRRLKCGKYRGQHGETYFPRSFPQGQKGTNGIDGCGRKFGV